MFCARTCGVLIVTFFGGTTNGGRNSLHHLENIFQLHESVSALEPHVDKVRVRKSLERFWKASCQRLLTRTQSTQFAVWCICISSHERHTFWINRNTQDSGCRKSLFYGHSPSQPVSSLNERAPTSVLALSQDWLHHHFHLTLWHIWFFAPTPLPIFLSHHIIVLLNLLSLGYRQYNHHSLFLGHYSSLFGDWLRLKRKFVTVFFIDAACQTCLKKPNVTYLEGENSTHGSFGRRRVPMTLSSLQCKLWEDARSAKREQSA